ncbi:hypothetical protein ZWY2020_035839 [Hordeum vulgare]|nr:hypothetical protein ZWY2020_035839 [Hordeum vulgare]
MDMEMWRLHLAPCSKYVAFKGIHSGRRFYGCAVQVNLFNVKLNKLLENGIDCGLCEWVDATWPGVLQRCLVKFWEMFLEENHGMMLDHQAHQEETAKLKLKLDKQQNKVWRNDEDLQKKEMDVDKEIQKLAINKEKEKLENDKMKEEFEKLVIEHKELKCIAIS